MRVIRTLISLLLQLLTACALAAEQAPAAAPPPQAPPPPSFPCQEEKQSAQFDFWVGEWDVLMRGRLVGHSRIEALPGGCLITEHYEAVPPGYAGKSLNFYDPVAKAWKQTWVDNAGSIVYFEGQAQDGGMVLTGQRIGRGGPSNLSRMTFTPNTDGTVRQFVEVSKDGGKTWAAGFDGTYVKKAGA